MQHIKARDNNSPTALLQQCLEWTRVLGAARVGGLVGGGFPKGSVSMRTRSRVIQYQEEGGGRGQVKLRGLHRRLSLESGMAKCQAGETFSLN